MLLDFIKENELMQELQEVRERYGTSQRSNLCSCLVDRVGGRAIVDLTDQERTECLDILQHQLTILGDPADWCYASQFDLTVEWDLPGDWFSLPKSHRQRVLTTREDVLTKLLGEGSRFFIHELDLDDLFALSV